MKKITRFGKKFLYRILEDYVTIHAAYTTLFIFMSLFPLLMFLLNLLSIMKVDEKILLNQINHFIPEAFQGLVKSIINNISDSSSGLILSISVVTSIWAASSGVYGIMLGLNDVYRTYDTRNYLEKRSIAILYTFVFVLMVGVSLLVLVFGRRITDLLTARFPSWKTILDKIHDLKYPVAFLVLAFFFNIMYVVLPHGVNRFFQQTPGSIFASGGWLLFSYVFSLYVNSAGRTTLYGSLAAVCFFLLWMWVVMIIIFLGGEINASIHDHKYGEDIAELRMINEHHIREREKQIRKDHMINAMERYNLRKTTTRTIDTNRLVRQMEEEQENADTLRREKEEKEHPSKYSNN